MKRKAVGERTLQKELPVKTTPAAQAGETESVKVPHPTSEGGHETILLCEDEGLLRKLAAGILREGGYTVIEAENGEQAVRRAAGYKGAIQLLLTDWVMPGMKGDQVAAEITKNRPAARVLFMSGYASEAISTKRIEKDRRQFLEKPFRREGLLERVREILDRPEN